MSLDTTMQQNASGSLVALAKKDVMFVKFKAKWVKFCSFIAVCVFLTPVTSVKRLILTIYLLSHVLYSKLQSKINTTFLP